VKTLRAFAIALGVAVTVLLAVELVAVVLLYYRDTLTPDERAARFMAFGGLLMAYTVYNMRKGKQ